MVSALAVSGWGAACESTAVVFAASEGATSAAGVTGAASAFGAGGWSTRSMASTGGAISPCWAAEVSGAGRQDPLSANCSWAARSTAAAPRPNTRTDVDRRIAANRKRKPGSMGNRFRLAGRALQGLKAIRERGDHRIGHIRFHQRRAIGKRIRLVQEYRKAVRPFVKNRRR